ncbi:sensor histidine kinase [Ekhidna sp.]|uniref:sensor histidine kinase n=1 Tax=Ekhidna sp. TaxID=2608089 RepID=UPI003C7DFB2D
MFSNKYRYIYITLLGVYSFLNIKFTEGDKAISANLGDFTLLLVIMSLTLAVWECNHLIERCWKKIEKLAPKLIYRFLLSIVVVSVLSIIASYVVGIITSQNILLPGFKQTLGFAFRINLFLHSINALYQYNRALSNSRLEAEQLKKQTTEAKLEALKNQVNPHFLFNSLNILTSVIEEDSDAAVKYVNELSKVYRYLLKTERENLVSLDEELSFISSYLFLLKLRFHKNLDVEIDVQEKDQCIPPSTLQLLIENAIKHNEISNAHTLKIRIFQQNDQLIVENNTKARSNKPSRSGIGLNNISNRYVLITSRTPEIVNNSGMFIVKLPVIESITHENHNNRR